MENSQLFKDAVKFLGSSSQTQKEALLLAAGDLQNEVLSYAELEDNPGKVLDEYHLRASLKNQA